MFIAKMDRKTQRTKKKNQPKPKPTKKNGYHIAKEKELDCHESERKSIGQLWRPISICC